MCSFEKWAVNGSLYIFSPTLQESTAMTCIFGITSHRTPAAGQIWCPAFLVRAKTCQLLICKIHIAFLPGRSAL
jgi:hypothetical protein